MEEKENYTPKQIAQMCMAFLKIYGQKYTNFNEMNRFSRFVPKNVRDEISNLRILTEDMKELRDAHEKVDYKTEGFEEFLIEYSNY